MPSFSKQALKLKSEAVASMLRYLEISRHTDYTKEHVDECDRVLRGYIDWTSVPRPKEEIIEQTEKLVVTLNDLNQRCGGTLIETDQREAICAMIIKAAQNAGYDDDQDFTGEWREW